MTATDAILVGQRDRATANSLRICLIPTIHSSVDRLRCNQYTNLFAVCVFTDHVSEQGNAMGSVCPSVRPFVSTPTLEVSDLLYVYRSWP